ncbi:MAG: SDR family NAD(P)-dependent oxidoreductase [Proteobacteria bacterium]|nr:MAG: SDR family NAD(P)-dependent oxidoreductase [Pseudomonadota bacterium]
MTEVSLRRQMEVNFFGTVRLTQKLLPLLRSSRGVILTVSSVLGRHAFPLTGGYCASKFAVEGWMESLAAEVKPYGISAYILEPGAFPTGFGTSLDWAKPLENSPYIKSSEGYERLRLKISKRNKNKKLEPVGQKMVKLLTRRPSSLRHPIGSDAVATMIFARLLPTNLYARIIGSLMNRLQRIHAS